MNRFYVTFELAALADEGEADISRSEAFIDATLQALLERSELIDPDAGSEPATGRLEFMMVTEARTPERAVTLSSSGSVFVTALTGPSRCSPSCAWSSPEPRRSTSPTPSARLPDLVGK